MRYNCKKILNNIKSVVPHPDLDKIVRKEMPGIKNFVASKHAIIMTGIATGIISEDMGFTQMRLVYIEADDKVCMWIDQVDNMIEFLEELKEHHNFTEYMKLDPDQQKMFDYIHKEIIKYQRLSAELMGLSMYIDTMVDDYGLLGPLDDMEDDDAYNYVEEDPDEDGKDLDILHDAETDYLEEEGIDKDLYYEFKEKIINVSEFATYRQTDPGSIVVSLNYQDGDILKGFAIRCNSDDTFEFGDNANGPTWIIPRLKLGIHQFEYMINEIDDENNPFIDWYCGDDKNAFPEIYRKWHSDDEDDDDDLVDETSDDPEEDAYKHILTKIMHATGCIEYYKPVDADYCIMQISYCTESEDGSFFIKCIKDGYFRFGDYPNDEYLELDEEEMTDTLRTVEKYDKNNALLKWFNSKDANGYLAIREKMDAKAKEEPKQDSEE